MYYSVWMGVLFFCAVWHVHWRHPRYTLRARCTTTVLPLFFLVIKKLQFIFLNPNQIRQETVDVYYLSKGSDSYSHPNTTSLMASFKQSVSTDGIFCFNPPHIAHSVPNSLILPRASSICTPNVLFPTI